ncbi:MAG TPA: SpoIIE family protein phosphatase [Candidatus Krumholzibacteria bacterium]|nr:SpoIIE family protein phosphatase [Candidatus Krumholzibacteria bacterium]
MKELPTARPAFPGDRAAPLLRPLLLVFVLAIVVLEFPGARERVESPYSGIQTRNLVVQHVEADGPNAGADIRSGDEIVGIDGRRLRNRLHLQHLVASNHRFQPQVYELRRAGASVRETVRYDEPPRRILLLRAALLVLAALFIGVGLWVYMRRADALGTLFALNSILLAVFLTDRPSTANPVWQLGGELIADAFILLFPATLLHFFLRFPDRPRREGARRGRSVWLYAAPVLIFGLSAAVAARRFHFLGAPDAAVTLVLGASTLYFVAYLLASLVVFVRAYRSSPRAQKQKLRVVIAGTLAGLLPFIGATLQASVHPEKASLSPFAALCLGFVPLAFGYAIVKHGAIELNAVVRKSLVYAVLTGLLVAGYYLVVQSLGTFLTREFGVSEYAWLPFAVLALAVAFAPVRERVQGAVDRLFYRADYVYRQEVVDFGRSLARTLTRDEILDQFVRRCEALLHPSFVAVYLRNGNRELTRARGDGPVPETPATFSADAFLGRYLTRFRTPLPVEYLDPSWERPRLDAESRALLSVPGLAVCVPIAAPDRLIGLVLLGQKRSGLVYRRDDNELLETFADQIALVIENADLIQSSIEKERLKSEVLLARDIQQALLPETPPRLHDIEIQGRMVSSTEVGGDYFDYFPLDADRVVVAIGDVSGKGVPAAMLMASLQAVFKNRAIKGELPPGELNRELNDFLVEHAKPGQFATFFCGILDVPRATLTYSSAGQCPALLATDRFVDRLGNGGMVLGAHRSQEYVEGTVAFRPGDLLLLYTDGITEQRNPSGELFGEERLVDFLRANRNLSPDGLQNALLDAVLAFGQGHQEDDITSVIVLRKTA